MSFTPNFADLVRNTTTTTGTADFKLGPAVNGYTSFTSALQVGDSFYYAALGVDKPAEREVGRGTLLSNGLISRDPVSGTKTNFTSGTKTISLVAAAEWFAGIQAGSGAAAAAPAIAATRSALSAAPAQLPALLTEPGREGLFVFDGSNLSSEVGADPQGAIFVPVQTDASGASGAWVRKFSGPKDPRWFGAKGDGLADDYAALQAWLDSGGELTLPARRFRSSQKLIVRRLCRLSGEVTHGFDSSLTGPGSYEIEPGSRVVFDAGVAGLDIQPSTTLTDPAAVAAAGAAAFTQQGAYNSIVENIGLVSMGGAAQTGVYARTLIHLNNVQVYNFAGKGFDLSASSDAIGDGNSEYGNMSNSTLVDCAAWNCGSHGLHIRGRDANTINVKNFNAFQNGGWGILNESLLGNVFDKPHCATNALGAIKIPGNVACSIIKPYIEIGTGNNVEINTNCVVSGEDLSTINAGGGTPTSFSGQFARFNRVFLQNAWPPEAYATEMATVFKHDGLILQGRGSTRDVSLYNGDGQLAAYVARGTIHLTLAGTLYARMWQTNGANSSWPGAADGYMAVYCEATRGAVIGGFGTTGDVTLANNAGSTAAYVPHGTTGLAVAGALTTQTSVGYMTGAGGAVTQATSKSTGVTLNKACGAITMNAASLAAGGIVEFTVTNSAVGARDIIVLNLASGAATTTAYRYWTSAVGAGSFKVCIENRSAGALSEALVLNFAVIKAVNA